MSIDDKWLRPQMALMSLHPPKGKETKENNTRDFNVVPHCSTDGARTCVTSQSTRDVVQSCWYGHSQLLLTWKEIDRSDILYRIAQELEANIRKTKDRSGKRKRLVVVVREIVVPYVGRVHIIWIISYRVRYVCIYNIPRYIVWKSVTLVSVLTPLGCGRVILAATTFHCFRIHS